MGLTEYGIRQAKELLASEDIGCVDQVVKDYVRMLEADLTLHKRALEIINQRIKINFCGAPKRWEQGFGKVALDHAREESSNEVSG